MGQLDIDGNQSRKVVKIATFADEIKPSADSNWAYITVLSVPWDQVNVAYARIRDDRRTSNYDHELKWRGISERGLKSKHSPKEELARAWLSRIVHEHDLWRFSIVGIDTAMLSMNAFGELKGKQLVNSYRRFYRSNLKRHVSLSHRGADLVRIERCFHDQEGRLEIDPWFSRHPIAVINRKETVEFAEHSIRFVNSCHNKEQALPKASHFIQMADILGAASRYVLEAVGRNHARDYIVEPLIPLLERINDPKQSGNINSRYKHVGRASISYFPSRALEDHELEDDILRAQSTFFNGRPLKLLQERAGQTGLDL